MRLLLDSSILIEYVKGTRTELLDAIFDTEIEPCINHIVFSEFIFHFLSVISGKSPLTLKKSGQINQILDDHDPIEFINNFTIIDMTDEMIRCSYDFMKKYSLLPNDALILAASKHHKIAQLASYDLDDFTIPCEKEKILLVDSDQKLRELLNRDCPAEND